ncbi:hypothetical protein GDO78_001026 [Eleutherodactylus coqui]|uniref:Uncharacterized protein n=1 Tax=Eleutherodactylus coqui TaxID=57060 RepID=A0A8J6FUC0_ELECQ|nr:hypothetical protein GDO78_001026 [Eleutherodactylus coqui]
MHSKPHPTMTANSCTVLVKTLYYHWLSQVGRVLNACSGTQCGIPAYRVCVLYSVFQVIVLFSILTWSIFYSFFAKNEDLHLFLHASLFCAHYCNVKMLFFSSLCSNIGQVCNSEPKLQAI